MSPVSEKDASIMLANGKFVKKTSTSRTCAARLEKHVHIRGFKTHKQMCGVWPANDSSRKNRFRAMTCGASAGSM